jgi:uncharacterized protein (DUF983 family)
MSDDTIHGEDKAIWPPIDPISAGLHGSCPRCGEEKLFPASHRRQALRQLRPRLFFADAGDGPAVFVI